MTQCRSPRSVSLTLLLSILLFSFCGIGEPGLEYPESRTVGQVDLLHGVEVRDPFRWLEAMDSEETKKWIEAQNAITFRYLDQLPRREELGSRLTELWDYEKFGVPRKEGDRYFFSHNNGLQDQNVIYWIDAIDGQPVELLDPNQLSRDGTIALTSYQISPDGKYMAYGVSAAGSDWQEWRIRQVEDGQELNDHIKWVKFSNISWIADSKGFFYSRYDEPKGGEELQGTNYYQKLYLHRVGDDQSEDLLIYERPDQMEWIFNGEVTEDGRYLIILVRWGTRTQNGIFYKDLSSRNGDVIELLGQFDARYEFIGNNGAKLWFLTDLEAPRARIVEIDLNDPKRDAWRTMVNQAEETLDSARVLNGELVCSYLKDAHSAVRIFNTEGELIRELDLPGIGSAGGFTGKAKDGETFYSFTGFTFPTIIYHYDLKSGESSIFRRPEVAFDPEDFETRQVFYHSSDGTRIPMFISHKKGIQLNGNNPTLLYGYGGYNISLTPTFSVTNLVWMEKGGVYALANLRGGGEYGEEWHQAGTKLKKQNVFDDFIAAAEWLIENRYTSHESLGIEGASNGGLLIGAVLNQRPDLFGAAVPRVGVMDMLRFHKFTIGWAWVSDFGSPDNSEEFQAIYAYSPYHNIQEDTEYPATLIMTADHDDRVVPLHSYKYAAALQQAQAGPEPILIRIETRAGHGAGKPTSKRIEESRDKLAFLLHELVEGQGE